MFCVCRKTRRWSKRYYLCRELQHLPNSRHARAYLRNAVHEAQIILNKVESRLVALRRRVPILPPPREPRVCLCRAVKMALERRNCQTTRYVPLASLPYGKLERTASFIITLTVPFLQSASPHTLNFRTSLASPSMLSLFFRAKSFTSCTALLICCTPALISCRLLLFTVKEIRLSSLPGRTGK